MSGRARNDGTVATGVNFSNNFTYRYGTSGAWNPIATIGHPPLGPGEITPTPDWSNAFVPATAASNLYFQHCVDSTNAVNEGTNESPNCTVQGPITVISSPCSAGTISGCSLPLTNPGSSAGSCASGYLGSCSYSCTNGTWTENSNSCSQVPTVTNFTATPNPVPYGESTQLSWSSLNTTSCTAGGDWSGTKGTSGNESTGPITSSKTYTLYCTGPGGNSSTQTINLAVACSAQTINGCNLPLTVSGSSAGTCASGYGGGCNYTCTNGTWNENTNSCSAPIISEFKICNVGEVDCVSSGTKSSVVSSTNEIHWSATNANFCTAVSGNGFTTGNARTGMDTFLVDATAGVLRTYTLGCGNGGVLGITRSIDVLSVLPLPTITTSERVVEEGDTVTLSWNTNGGNPASCSIRGGSTNLATLATPTGSISVVVNARTTYTITCGPNSGKVTVEVIPRGFES